MNKQLPTWQLILDSLQQNIAVMLLYVLQSEGSSPGRQGFCMAVNESGKMEGSIGGGIMEHKFVEMAKEKLSHREDEASIKKQVHNKSAAKNQSGMICSGEQTIFIYRVQPDDAVTIQQILTSLSQLKNGTLQLSPAGIEFSDAIPPNDFLFSMQSEEDWLYREKTGYKNQLYIIGAGHCALALSKMMSLMDFHIHLFDDRSDLNTFTRNEYVHEKTIVDDYSTLKDVIDSGDHQYVVVMTVGYRTDDIVVKALLDKEFRYFGLLGSKAKIEKLFSDYRAAGISSALLQKIHAPVGMAIKSQTPEEIAISIAAQIIQVKNSGFFS
jgi:xanthine dehydrogenase accessory factor